MSVSHPDECIIDIQAISSTAEGWQGGAVDNITVHTKPEASTLQVIFSSSSSTNTTYCTQYEYADSSQTAELIHLNEARIPPVETGGGIAYYTEQIA